MRPRKIDFRFLFYTPKNIYLKKKYTFLNVYKVKKIPIKLTMEYEKQGIIKYFNVNKLVQN